MVHCKFWNAHQGGGCRFGDHCQYEHTRWGKWPCKYFSQAGGCKDGDRCVYAHDTGAAPSASSRSRPCKYFSQPGGCKEGDRCAYFHDSAAARAVSVRSTASTRSARPRLPPQDVRQQQDLGAQSLRGLPGGASVLSSCFGGGPGAAHAARVFQEMLANERKLAGEWAVFYHSYNGLPGFLYEVQGAIAKVLFRFGAEYAPLPRLLKAPFEAIPGAEALLKAFPSWPDKDHNPQFKGVGICCTTSLISADPEATPTQHFLAGYAASQVPMQVLEQLLASCGAGRGGATAAELARRIVELGVKHGHPQATGQGFQGHLLQIFIHRSCVDRYAYASFPMGIPDGARHPISACLAGPGPIAGQARVVANPSGFMRSSKVRMFVGSADERFHRNRRAFQAEVGAVLQPILGTPAAREQAARGVYNGRLPSWWSDVAGA